MVTGQLGRRGQADHHHAVGDGCHGPPRRALGAPLHADDLPAALLGRAPPAEASHGGLEVVGVFFDVLKSIRPPLMVSVSMLQPQYCRLVWTTDRKSVV